MLGEGCEDSRRFLSFFFLTFFGHAVCPVGSSPAGVEPAPPASEAQSLSHWMPGSPGREHLSQGGGLRLCGSEGAGGWDSRPAEGASPPACCRHSGLPGLQRCLSVCLPGTRVLAADTKARQQRNFSGFLDTSMLQTSPCPPPHPPAFPTLDFHVYCPNLVCMY